MLGLNHCPIPKLKIVEVFEYYDGPKLFSCSNELDHLFLAFWVEELDDGDRWIVVPISKQRLERVRIGQISLRDVIVNSETGSVLEYIIPFNGEGFKKNEIQSSQIDEMDLPHPEARLNMPDKLLPDREDLPVNRAAQIRRDVIDLLLITNNQHSQEIESELLAKVLLRVQSLAYTLADDKKDRRGKIPEAIKNKSKLNVTGFFAASFGVRLESPYLANLFNESDATDPIEKLVKLFKASGDKEKLKSIFPEYTSRTKTLYQYLLNTLNSGNAEMGIEWASPDKKSDKVFLSREKISRTIQILKEEGNTEETEILVLGTLSAVDTTRGTFKLITTEGERFTGKLSESLQESIFQVPAFGKATLLESIEIHKSTFEETYSYELKDFEINDLIRTKHEQEA